MLPRIWGNDNSSPVKGGTLAENGTGKFSDIDKNTLEYLKWLGCSHVWYTGILRHSTQASEAGCTPSHPQFVKGKAGSPYAICDYYDVNAYLADDPQNRMGEFEDLIRRTHEAGLKVIMDFVPNHVSRDYGKIDPTPGHPVLGAEDDKSVHWKPENDFFYYPGQSLTLPTAVPEGMEPYHECPAMATGNNCYTASPGINDWFETVKINYGDTHTGTWDKMLDIIMFWASKGVDGFRCDMAEMVPVAFWHWVIAELKKRFSKLIFIAEVYNPSLYRSYIKYGGFDYLYDKVGLYDTLRGVMCGYTSASEITKAWQAVGDIQNNMLLFLENHDEQRIASEFFANNSLKGIPAMMVATLLTASPTMCYFAQELGERGMDEEGFSGRDGRTTIFDYWSVSSIRRWRNKDKFDGKNLTDEEKKLQSFYRTLLNLCNTEKAIRNGEFFDLTYANLEGCSFNEHKQYAFLRKCDKDLILIVVNFDEAPATPHIKIPAHAFEYLGIPEKKSYKTKELLTNKTDNISISPDQSVQVSLDGYGGILLKISL